MASQNPAAGKYIVRQIEGRIETALADTRIVAIVGPRQSGKTTLAKRIAAARQIRFVSLDDGNARELAANDPAGFMRNRDAGVIDEIQHAPELIFSLKMAVDNNPQPGRWLITSSIDLFRTAIAPDSLAGRIEVIELLPLSQTEIEQGNAGGFLRRAFACDFPGWEETGLTENLIDRVLTGGYPEIFLMKSMKRRAKRLRMQARMLALHELPELLPVRKADALEILLDQVKGISGQLVNLSRLGAILGVSYKTADSWLTLLERMFLLKRVPAWHRSQSRRLVRASKLHFLDSGMLAALLGVSENSLATNRQALGPLLESFVFSEIIKALPHHEDPVRISHYRDRSDYEIDLVLDTPDGRTVGLEVKAAASIHPKDFRGLKRLAGDLGDRFACGIVLHDGDRTMRFGERMFAMPFRTLWES